MRQGSGGRHFNFANVTSALALFIALSTGSAYATHPGGVNTISTGDIINGEVRSIDILNGDVQQADIAVNSIGTAQLEDGGVLSVDIGPGKVLGTSVVPNAINSSRVANDSLTGDDIQEGTLAGVDADELDGKDASEFAQGNATIVSNRISAEFLSQPVLLDLPQIGGLVAMSCFPGEIRFGYSNVSGPAVLVYTDDGSGDPIREHVDTGQFSTPTSSAGHDRVILQIGRDSEPNHDLATVTITGSSESDNPCPAAAQAILHTN